MKLPGAERAVVDVRKLRNYCLNPMHPRGRHKARVFASALRIAQADAEFLKDTLLTAALHHEATSGEADVHGKRYTLEFECVRGNLKAMVLSGWIVRAGEDFPSLTTCYVLLN